MTKRILSTILAITTITLNTAMFFAPQSSSASVQGAVASSAGCTAGALLTPIAEQAIDAALNKVSDFASQKLGDLLGHFFNGFSNAAQGVGGVLGGPIPVQDSTVGSTIGAYSQAETRNQMITRCLSYSIMNNLSNKILQTIQIGGRDGGPAFVTNWTNFQTNAQYRGENIFRAELSTAHLCNYLSDNVKKAYGVDPAKKIPIIGQNLRTDSLVPFSVQTNCTMPAGFTPQKYQQNFVALGGWDAFIQYISGANNPIGLNAVTQDELQKQRAQQESADVNQVLANKGYVGVSGSSKADSCQVMGPTGVCLTFKNIKTTGDYLSQSVGATIGAQFSWLTSAQGINSIISDFTQVMVNRLFDQGDTSTRPVDVGANAYNPTPTQLTLPIPNPSSAPNTSPGATTAPANGQFACTTKTSGIVQTVAAVSGDLNPGIGFTNQSGQDTFRATMQRANDALTQLNLDGATGSLKLEQDFSALLQSANDYFNSSIVNDQSPSHLATTQKLADAFVAARNQALNTAAALIQTCAPKN